jgi:hypothetical protein
MPNTVISISYLRPIRQHQESIPEVKEGDFHSQTQVKATGKTAFQVLIDRPNPITGKNKRFVVGRFNTVKEAERAERDAKTKQDRGTCQDTWPDNRTRAIRLQSGRCRPQQHLDALVGLEGAE